MSLQADFGALIVALGFSVAAHAEGHGVLLLGDAGSQSQVQFALESAGLPVVYGGPYAEWDGVEPSAEDFRVVVFLDGIDYHNGFQPQADAALAAMVAGGGGLVITEWAAYDQYWGQMSPNVGALIPVVSSAGALRFGGTWTVLDDAHPLCEGLPASWWDVAEYSEVVPAGGSTVVMEDPDGIPMLTYSTAHGGRVVHLNHSLAYASVVIHPNALDLLINATVFAGDLDAVDCNANGVPDHDELAGGSAVDLNRNRIIDVCDADCNENGLPDDLDVRTNHVGQTTFTFSSGRGLDWQDSDDNDSSSYYGTMLPFVVELGGETFTEFLMSSNGYVELLHAGEQPYEYSYGSIADLIGYGDPTHTYLLAGYDDLSSYDHGYFGYRLEHDRVVFYWNTETYADSGADLLNRFEIVLYQDGLIEWHFGEANYVNFSHDLFSGVYFGYAGQTLIEVVSGTLPSAQSWGYMEGMGTPQSIPHEMLISPPSLDWAERDDDAVSPVAGLPTPVELGGEVFIGFVQNSNGYVELLREGEAPYGFTYGVVADLINDDGGTGGPTHTFLMAGFDDLSSYYTGLFGYRVEVDHVLFYWNTETYDDSDTHRPNTYEMILHASGEVDWNFELTAFGYHGYDLFTGVYLGHDEQTLFEVLAGNLPRFQSWRFDPAGIIGGGSADADGNGQPDECEVVGDLTGDGIVDVLDLLALLGAWGDCPPTPPCPADLDGSGAVGILDLLLLLGNWTV